MPRAWRPTSQAGASMTDPSTAPVPARVPVDANARAQALDPCRSFIVQAPAGSGKTELLIRRVLVLLAHVDAPEEIVALTFTRKAAAQMRTRVLAALERAQDDTPPATDHERGTWQLARRALARNAACGWALTSNPSRLRIQTIDGLCAGLVRRMPLLSRLGGMPSLLEDAEPLYREAARATLALLEADDADHAAAIATLLLHLDNRSGTVEEMLVRMLARRDQWIRHAARHDAEGDRTALEAALQRIRADAVDPLQKMLAPLADRLVALAAWAAGNLPDDSEAALLGCRQLAALPGREADDTAAWLGLADLLLTKEGGWRRRVDKRLGFAPASEARSAEEKQRRKEAQQALLDLVADCDAVPGLCDALVALRDLPPPRYDNAQWDVLSAVIRVLRLAAAQLELVFARRGACDFTAVAQGALHALGTPTSPSDLLLALDARIAHLLIDEFQDTSVTQFELLERLTAGWTDGDGRTLMLVGDPMQSIYLFRQAQVGLFLRARHHGVGSVALEPLQLTTNFRSAQGIVEWVNQSFARVLAPREDVARGAVPFEPAADWHPAGPVPAVAIHADIDGNAAEEAVQVAAIVAQAREADPSGSIAVLVRSRSHLAAIVPALRALAVPLRAVEIEPLRQRPIVLDLMALTRALLHPADRIAWLAVLRAPWCGLQLVDLVALAGADARGMLWPRLNAALATGADDAAPVEALSSDGQARLRRLVEALSPSQQDARRGSLADSVEGAWLRLGGADCVSAPRDLTDARAYLDLLAELEHAGDLVDLDQLDARLDKLFAAPDTVGDGTAAVELMTIHKAKGLEFDTVIVPGLHRRPRNSEAPLLAWTERPRSQGEPDLVLGTVAAAGAGHDGVHRWIGALERERERLEAGRLMYVAATRAKRHLHLLGGATRAQRKDGPALREPSKDTLLAALWPAVVDEFDAAFAAGRPSMPEATQMAEELDARTWRLPLQPALRADDARLPRLTWQAPPPASEDRRVVEFSWAGETVRLAGVLVHRWLQRLADRPDREVGFVTAQADVIERELAALGVPRAERAGAVQRTLDALRGTLADERGRWVLMARPAAAQAASELKLTGLDGGRLVNIAIDRSFIDNGVRWVIDYKTGIHEGAGRDAFLDREVERYRDQLSRYARLVGAMGPEPVRCALYFPLLGEWREWDANVATAAN